jgi:glutamate dehydrogenase
MTDIYTERLQTLLTQITQELPAGTPEETVAFVREYFAKMPLNELEQLNPADAAETARQSYAFMQARPQANTPHMRLIQAKDGFGRVVLEIINDDMPFLVDSLGMELTRQGFQLFQTIHPIFRVVRDAHGTLQQVAPVERPKQPDTAYESFIHIEMSALPAHLTEEKLLADLNQVLTAVRLSVQDWHSMLLVCAKTQTELDAQSSVANAEELQEVKEFLAWLRDKNFVFLGSIEYDFVDDKGNERLSVVEGSELGVFRMDDSDLKPQGLHALAPEVLHFARVPNLVEITKSNRRSLVHRPVNMDYIGVKRFDDKGNVIGERRLLGLFTSIVYYQSAAKIPLIRRKFERILVRANYDPASHDGKSLKSILEFASRDELFQISEDDLFEYALGVLALESRPAVRLFTRKDAFERFVSCTVFVPKDRFSTSLREQIQEILEDAYQGQVTGFNSQMTDSPLARAHLIVRTEPGNIPNVNIKDVEARITAVTYGWADTLKEALSSAYEPAQAARLAYQYGRAFPPAYVQAYQPNNAVHDIQRLEEVLAHDSNVGLQMFRWSTDPQEMVRLKLFTSGAEASLSDILPMLENFGFRVLNEMPYHIQTEENLPDLWIRDFRLKTQNGTAIDVAEVKDRFEAAFLQVWRQECDNDAFNSLVLRAGLNGREVLLLRAYARYAKQATFPYSQESITAALGNYPAITSLIVSLFTNRFDPFAAGDRTAAQEVILTQIQEQLGNVRNIEDDRILQYFRDLILSTWRTNFYQRTEDGQPKSYISFKFNSATVPGLPLPRLMAEIYVFSQRVEGIHLRGGKVARGGLRWSDRREDFRTEVLGLVKAQMVKNAVIVPVGSKGGFVLKRPPLPTGDAAADRDAFLKEGIACYQNYLRGLLDITDNLVQGTVVPPQNVVCYDEDDPYLVVAADKGTASFSDYANAVSAEYGFWLGDAFASGGSVGYDHKKMGITARERHFREMGHDITQDPFTAVGIGDMAGDVFGNGMLRSDKMKLVAAFNHLHIFIDPNPDTAKSFAERDRLFKLPRSSWEDYDAKLISKGGGIYKRSEKSITISAEAAAVLGVEQTTFQPDELIRAILQAPVDLLWNGGIGTYVKAETETHEQVGDRGNNAVRINGNQLRARIIGEGGNLGFTQLGRIEAAVNGVRMNTDAIDNSAGVDCSDHEVNIKIAFGQLLQNNTLSVEKRDEILASMTDDVAYLVLTDNRLQTQAITIAELQGTAQLDALSRMMDSFEQAGQLNRAVEYLPSSKVIAERRLQDRGLVRPELAVLLSYAKNVLYPQLLESDLPDDPHLERDLLRYFPKTMQADFRDAITAHPLRREIIATMITNSIVNRGGIAFAHSFMELSGMSAAAIARAYIITRDAYGMRELWLDIEKQDGKMPASTQAALFQQAALFMERSAFWFLRTLPQPMSIAETVEAFAPGIATYMETYEQAITPTVREAYENKRNRYLELGASENMAHRIARLDIVSNGLDVVYLAQQSGLSVQEVASLFFALGSELQFGWLRRATSRMKRGDSHWERVAVISTLNQMSDHHRRLTAEVIALHQKGEAAEATVTRWAEANSHALGRYHRFVDDVKQLDSLTFPVLLVALRALGGLGGVSN